MNKAAKMAMLSASKGKEPHEKEYKPEYMRHMKDGYHPEKMMHDGMRRGYEHEWPQEEKHHRKYEPYPYGTYDESNDDDYMISARIKMQGPEKSKMTKEMAEAWTHHMQNEDGTMGAHWTMEQVKQVMAQRGIDCDPAEFYAAINMVYSDYSNVAKELGVNNIDFYAKMAKAFLDDSDAEPNKLARYYEYVVKH